MKMKELIVFINNDRVVVLMMDESTGKSRQVPQWAGRQALHFVFGLEEQDIAHFAPINRFKPNIRDGVHREVKAWQFRPPIERKGAVVMAFCWLVAQDKPSLRGKAASAGRTVLDALTEEEFDLLCERLNLSQHERMELFFPER